MYSIKIKPRNEFKKTESKTERKDIENSKALELLPKEEPEIDSYDPFMELLLCDRCNEPLNVENIETVGGIFLARCEHCGCYTELSEEEIELVWSHPLL